ncbi:MAG: ABC transporter ATP-binding protein [Candidatus Eremiobacteraeota bacterium]|nr:ABC transporter ATP-binding protein [Candidatus Eremiobacteraeota bacterium]MCW5870676.1 ABC transporter ATP-binding protein [Candidatus Eremiobacteraeota bacterium]
MANTDPHRLGWGSVRDVFVFTRRAFGLVWTTSQWLAYAFCFFTLLAGLLPATLAYVSKLLVDGVVAARALHDPGPALNYVVLEAAAVIALALVQKAIGVTQSLLRAQLGQRVNEMILEKALTLSLVHFEDSEFYDKLSQARRQASQRPLSLVNRTFDLLQQCLILSTYGVLLWQFSPYAVGLLFLAGLPTFWVEARFAKTAFQLFTWRSPESRMQTYLETLIAREDYVKEVKLFSLGELFLNRYRDIFHKLYAEDRALTLRRAGWGYALGLLSTLALYGAYYWIVQATVSGRLTLGEMSMYLLVFKQGQQAVTSSLSSIGGMYEDNLYLSNLYDFMAIPVELEAGGETQGPVPGDGLRFEKVSFTYPGAEEPALEDVSFHLKPGHKLALVGENGSGKTTIVKLLSRLYSPTGGVVKLDGLDLQKWDELALRQRIGVIFQDFMRYHFPVGENIGVGDVVALDEQPRWEEAARKGQAQEVIAALPEGYQTQLGRWFKGGRELSGGQWQKIALARAFMRKGADLLVLDEPTSAVDPKAEVQIFEHFRKVTENQMAILISHRFSTVRMADEIMVLEKGRVVEFGSHEQLLEKDGHYATLFKLQAAGYR